MSADDLLMGTHYYQFDRKGRVVIPRPLAAQLGETFILTRAPDQRLMAVSRQTWETLVGRLQSNRAFQEYYLAGAVECGCHPGTGRLQIPWQLREHAGFEQGEDVAVVGLGQVVVLVSRSRWEQHVAWIEARAVPLFQDLTGGRDARPARMDAA